MTPLPAMKPATRRVLAALLAAGARGATTHDLCQPDVGGIRVSARVFEIREIGLRVDVQQLRPGSYRYTLQRNAVYDRLFPPATDRRAA